MRFHFRSLGRTGAGVYGHNTEVNGHALGGYACRARTSPKQG